MLNLAGALDGRGYRVDLVLCRASGPYLESLAQGVDVVELRPNRLWPAYAAASDPNTFLRVLWSRIRHFRRFTPLFWLSWFPDLGRYLRRERPAALLAAKTSANIVALCAARFAPPATRVVICEVTHLSSELAHRGWGAVAPVIRRLYPRADARVAISSGVAEDVSRVARLPAEAVTTIYNPLASGAVRAGAAGPLDHPWFQAGAPPVVLGIGRLTRQKGFGTLLRAFAVVRAKRRTRLVILGEGEMRAELQASARGLGIESSVSFPGFVRNPYAYLARAAVFALSSVWEGLPTVLIEAMALGCPVVSTDCPSGPAEVLDGGRYGRLVPVADAGAMADAILATLGAPPSRESVQRGARRFSVDLVAEEYLAVLMGRGGHAVRERG